MPTAMEQLLALLEIDRQLLEYKKRRDAGPEEIRRQEDMITAAREARRAGEDAIKEKATAVDRCNLEIRTAEADIDDQQSKLKGIKSNKEYKIVTERIKDLKQTITTKETEALTAMEELDALRAALQEKLDAVNTAESKIEELKLEIEKEAEEIRDAVQDLRTKREDQLKRIVNIDPKAMEAYQMAFRRGAGLAMASMVDGICQVCFRKQSPNVDNIVRIARDIKKCVCAGCGRILYAKQTADPTPPATPIPGE